jgi:DNA-binding GntR family transcriptional regulator
MQLTLQSTCPPRTPFASKRSDPFRSPLAAAMQPFLVVLDCGAPLNFVYTTAERDAPVVRSFGEGKMARAARVVVQVERLRDQVYQLIRDDLKSGGFAPGQRLLEVELAERYGVSRTPVREALFQLSRDGLLSGNERGYTAPIYTKKDVVDRLEVKRLLALRVAEHVAAGAQPLQIKRLTKFLDQQKSANAAVNIPAFNEANHEFRAQYHSMCENRLLARCAQLVDDQFEVARNRIHELEENRQLSIEHDERLLSAIAAHDAKAAVKIIEGFLDFLEVYYAEHTPID